VERFDLRVAEPEFALPLLPQRPVQPMPAFGAACPDPLVVITALGAEDEKMGAARIAGATVGRIQVLAFCAQETVCSLFAD
jgi:hypothetical protein